MPYLAIDFMKMPKQQQKKKMKLSETYLFEVARACTLIRYA